jgi:hypothetical protein
VRSIFSRILQFSGHHAIEPVQLPPPGKLVKSELAVFVKHLSYEARANFGIEDLQQIQFPMRDIRDVYHLIMNHRHSEVSAMEWMLAVLDKDDFDEYAPQLASETASMVWRHARHNVAARRTLVLLALKRIVEEARAVGNISQTEHHDSTLDSFPYKMARSLRESQHLASTWDADDGKFIAALVSTDAYEPLMQECERRLQTPREFCLDVLQTVLPAGINDGVLAKLGSIVRRRTSFEGKFSEWVSRCLDEGTTTARAGLTSTLLEHLPRAAWEDSGVRPLTRWVKENALPNVERSLFRSLTPKAQTILKQWLGEITYRDFEQVARRIHDTIIPRLPIARPDKAQNALGRRFSFWENYASHFLRVSLFIPPSVFTSLSLEFVDKMRTGSLHELADHQHDGEICVLETENFIIIEFLRGRHSETRILKQSRALSSAFFGQNPHLNSHHFRALTHYEIRRPLDHQYLWQAAHVKILAQLGLLPALPNSARFKSDLDNHDNFTVGQMLLQEPPPHKGLERERSLQDINWPNCLLPLENRAHQMVGDWVTTADSEV